MIKGSALKLPKRTACPLTILYSLTVGFNFLCSHHCDTISMGEKEYIRGESKGGSLIFQCIHQIMMYNGFRREHLLENEIFIDSH